MVAFPTPTVLAPVAGAIGVGMERWIFFPTCVNYLSPTVPEITAGTDLSAQVKPDSVSGWSGSSDFVEFPNGLSRFKPKVPGMITAADSMLTINGAKSGVDLLSLFNDGSDGSTQTTGFMLRARIGFGSVGTPNKCRIFPVSVGSVAPSADMTAPQTYDVSFAITAPPSPLITVPTA